MKMIKTTIGMLLAAVMMTACVNEGNKTPLMGDTTTSETHEDSSEVVGIVGDGTSMHALELITLDTGDSLYFTFEVNLTDGIEIGDTVRVTYDREMGDEAATSIVKINQ